MLESKRVYAVVVAAGSGSRMKSKMPKQLMKMGSETILEKSCRAVLSSDYVDEIILVTSSDIIGEVRAIAHKISRLL